MDDIVKDSTVLKEALIARWEELGLTNKQVSQDALRRGIKGVTERSLSVWKHHSQSKGALNQYQLLVLSWLYGIKVRLAIGEPVIEDGKLRYIIPQPFDQKKSLEDFHKMFPFFDVMAKIEQKEVKKPRKKKNG